jgi:hypothetical protein
MDDDADLGTGRPSEKVWSNIPNPQLLKGMTHIRKLLKIEPATLPAVATVSTFFPEIVFEKNMASTALFLAHIDPGVDILVGMPTAESSARFKEELIKCTTLFKDHRDGPCLVEKWSNPHTLLMTFSGHKPSQVKIFAFCPTLEEIVKKKDLTPSVYLLNSDDVVTKRGIIAHITAIAILHDEKSDDDLPGLDLLKRDAHTAAEAAAVWINKPPTAEVAQQCSGSVQMEVTTDQLMKEGKAAAAAAKILSDHTTDRTVEEAKMDVAWSARGTETRTVARINKPAEGVDLEERDKVLREMANKAPILRKQGVTLTDDVSFLDDGPIPGALMLAFCEAAERELQTKEEAPTAVDNDQPLSPTATRSTAPTNSASSSLGEPIEPDLTSGSRTQGSVSERTLERRVRRRGELTSTGISDMVDSVSLLDIVPPLLRIDSILEDQKNGIYGHCMPPTDSEAEFGGGGDGGAVTSDSETPHSRALSPHTISEPSVSQSDASALLRCIRTDRSMLVCGVGRGIPTQSSASDPEAEEATGPGLETGLASPNLRNEDTAAAAAAAAPPTIEEKMAADSTFGYHVSDFEASTNFPSDLFETKVAWAEDMRDVREVAEVKGSGMYNMTMCFTLSEKNYTQELAQLVTVLARANPGINIYVAIEGTNRADEFDTYLSACMGVPEPISGITTMRALTTSQMMRIRVGRAPPKDEDIEAQTDRSRSVYVLSETTLRTNCASVEISSTTFAPR